MALFQDEKVTGEQFNKEHNLVKNDIFAKYGYDEIVKERIEKRTKIAEQEKLWVQNLISPEKIKEWENKGSMSPIEVWHKKNKNELIPYKGTIQQGSKSFDIKRISDKMKNGEHITPEEREKFQNFVLDMAEVQTRGYSFWGGAVNIGLETLPFMAEFAVGLLTSGGTASFGAASSKISTEVLKKSLTRKIGEGIVKTAYNASFNPKTLAFTATRLPQQVRARMGDILLSDSLAITPEGQAILKESETRPGIAFLKALALTQIEVGSELSGDILVRPMLDAGIQLSKTIASPIVKQLPEKFVKKFVELSEAAAKLPFLKAVDNLGFNGVLEEIGEERIGDLLKFAFNLDDEEGYSFEQLLNAAFPSVEQLAQETISFGLTGVGMNAAHTALKAIPKTGEKYSKDGFLLDTGIFRINGYNSYLDTKVRDELEKKGKSEEEIQIVLDSATRDDKVQFLHDVKADFDTKTEFDNKKAQEDFETNLKQAEVEEQVYNKLLQGGVSADTAFANAKLFGQFFKKYGAKNKEAFDKWFNKFDVQYNVPSEETKENLRKQAYQNANNYYQMSNEIDNVVDLSNEFDKNPTIDEVKAYINEVIEQGTKFATLSPDWFVDIKGGSKKKDHIIKSSHFAEMNKSQKNRHRKYIMSLEKLLAKAEYAGAKENTKPDKKPNIAKYHYFKTNVKIGDKTYQIIFDTEEYINEKSASSANVLKSVKNLKADTDSITDNSGKIKQPQTVHLYDITELKNKKKNREIEQAKKEWEEKGTESKYFKKWFGNSKVVDEQGKPLVVYHGSKIKFDIFASGKRGARGVNEDTEGFYFSPFKEGAENYAGTKYNVGYVYPVYLSIQNPYIAQSYNEIGTLNKEKINNLKAQGYDGAIFIPSNEDIKKGRYDKYNTEYVAFNPEQIKSVNNQGTFDSSNPNIYYQSKYAPKTIKKAQEVKNALQKIADGSEEETVADLRNDLEQYGGTNDVTFIFGDNKKGIQHIAQKHGIKTLLGVFDAVIDGNISKFVKGNKTVHIEKNGIEAVLSLDENGNKKTWLLTGWNNKISSDEEEQVRANSNPTQTKPTFSRQDLGAELSNIISDNNGIFNPDVKIYYQKAENSKEGELIAGFTYQEILDKLNSLYDELKNDDVTSEDEQDKIMSKIHVLEDAFEVSEHSEKYNSQQISDAMLNAYYVMKNQEIPKEYIDSDKTSLRTYRDYVDMHNEKKQKMEDEYYGYFTEGKDKNIITIMANSNSSTALHELGHLFLNGLTELSKADENARRQLEAVNKTLGFTGGEYTIAQQEKFARSFEAYLYKGRTFNKTLREVFANFKEWLHSVYAHITELVDKGADISDEVTEMFDKMFADDGYYQERKQADELLKKVKALSRKEKMMKIPVRDDSELDEVEKRHKSAAYAIVSAATGKSATYLKTIFETNSSKRGLNKKRENIEKLLDKVDDKITVSGGMRKEWSEFYSDTGVSYENDETDGDYKLFEQALNTIINKSYRNPEKQYVSEAEERAGYYEKIISDADREYKVLIRSYKEENRNAALAAMYEWISDLDNEIKQDYENKFLYDAAMIDRSENIDKLAKAKRQILAKAMEVENNYNISADEKYKQMVREIMKSLNFLTPKDKAKLTVNVLDISSVSLLTASIDNIMDIAKTMQDVHYYRKLESDIHKELKQTKNVKKNGRTVGKYDYKSNKIFEELRKLDKLSAEKANELRLESERFTKAEDNGFSYKDKLINKFLSYKANGRTFADTALMKELYDEIIKIKLIGKSAKSELDLEEKLSGEKDIQELIDIVQNKKDAKFLVKGYISGFGNLESILNAVFNKSIKDRYGAEILYADIQAQTFQYETKKKFEKEAAKIYGLPEWNWDYQILKYLGEKHTYTEFRRKYDTNGEMIKLRKIDRTLTKMDIICAYIWSKNKILEQRLINQFGEDTLYEMFDEMSLKDVKLAELMMSTAQSFYPMINRAFIDKYGLDLPKVSCYYPSTPERGSEVDVYNDYSSKSLNNGFTKERAQSELIPMDFHNPVEILYNHIDGVAKFAFMSNKLDTLNRRFKDPDLKRVIINKYGKSAYMSLEQSLMNITYKKEAQVFNGINKVLDNMIGNWIQANVAVKPIVGLKQLLSANNYAVDMPYMVWQAGFLKALANPKATIDYMMKIPYLKARYGGSMTNEFLKQTVENSAFAASKKLKDLASVFVKLGDIGAIVFGGKPYIDYLVNEKGLSEEEAVKQFILSTNRSQQSSAVSSLSNFQVNMTRNPVGKLFIAYKNAPQQYVRMCGDALVSAANGDMSKRQCAKIIFQFMFLQPFLYAAATSGSLFRLLFTGDDDDLLKDLKMSIFNLNASAVPILGDIYTYALNRLAYKEKYMPQYTPLLGDIENEINRISKEDVTAKDYFEAIGYMGLHVGLGYNFKAIGTIGSSIGDIANGDLAKGSMKVVGYTEKRANAIVEK